jgi:hypothetical protein
MRRAYRLYFFSFNSMKQGLVCQRNAIKWNVHRLACQESPNTNMQIYKCSQTDAPHMESHVQCQCDIQELLLNRLFIPIPMLVSTWTSEVQPRTRRSEEFIFTQEITTLQGLLLNIFLEKVFYSNIPQGLNIKDRNKNLDFGSTA